MINNNLDVTIATPFPLALLSPTFGGAQVARADDGGRQSRSQGGAARRVRARLHGPARARHDAVGRRVLQPALERDPVHGDRRVPAHHAAARLARAARAATGPLVQSSAHFPSTYTYLNLGREVEQGRRARRQLAGHAAGQRVRELLVPGDARARRSRASARRRRSPRSTCPRSHRFNLGVVVHRRALSGEPLGQPRERGLLAGRARRARTTARPTAYTMVNVSAGVKWTDGKYQATLKVTNLGESGHPAAHLRRRAEAAGRRRADGAAAEVREA